MKRFLVLATTAAAILSSCTKQFVDESKSIDGSGLIGFDTYVANSTKGVAKGGFVMGDQFFAYAGSTGNAPFDIAAPNNGAWVFDVPNFPEMGARVSNYGGTPAVWRYDNPVAWDESKVTFFAFSPVPEPTAGGETYGITMANPAVNTIPFIDFAVKGGYDPTKAITSAEANAARVENKKQVDLLWAFTADKSKVDKNVDLMFKHALTQLNFSVKSNAPAGHMIRINTIAVKNVIKDGRLALAHNETAAPAPGDLGYLGGWNPGSTIVSFPVNLKNSVAALIKDNAVHAINDNDEALMMIPQILTDVELEVCYAYSSDGVTWENYQTGTPVTVKLGELSSHTHWNPNKAIRYILNITPGEMIGFTANVEAWGNEGNVEFLSTNPGKDAANFQTVDLKTGDSFYALNGGWITYDDGNGAQPLTATPVAVAADATYTFAVMANSKPLAREDQIIIMKADGLSQTVIKVTQNPSDGIFNIGNGAADAATITLKAGDRVNVPQTKTAATWIKYKVDGGVETEFAGEYENVSGDDQEFTLIVEENIDVARAATIVVTPADGSGVINYTIKQAGITIVTEAVTVKADGTLSSPVTLAGLIISDLSENATDWLYVDDFPIIEGMIPIAGSGVLTADPNVTPSERVATFRVLSADKQTATDYTVTQAAANIVVNTVPVAVAADGTFSTAALAGTVSELSVGADAWLSVDGDAIANGVIAGAGTLTAEVNKGAQRVATFKVTSVDGLTVNEYTVTQAAATAVTIPEIALDGTSTEVVALVAGDKILAGTDVSWLTLTSPATTETYTGTEVEVADAGNWTVAGSDNTVSTEVRSGSFTVLKADGNVVVYTVSQANA